MLFFPSFHSPFYSPFAQPRHCCHCSHAPYMNPSWRIAQQVARPMMTEMLYSSGTSYRLENGKWTVEHRVQDPKRPSEEITETIQDVSLRYLGPKEGYQEFRNKVIRECGIDENAPKADPSVDSENSSDALPTKKPESLAKEQTKEPSDAPASDKEKKGVCSLFR